jgi:hypothetical protein
MANTHDIREQMEVTGSDGTRVGKVDRVEGISIRLSPDTPVASGEHRYIPLIWVERVDQGVRLKKHSRDVQDEWQAHPVREGEYPPDDVK